MKRIDTKLPGVYIIEPVVHGDHRGYFMETYSAKIFADMGIDTVFVQDNQSFTAKKGTLRGIHFQNAPMAQAKLVRVTRGAVLDVAVDLRKGSPTYGKHVAVELTEENHRQFFVPRGFAHGFAVLSEEAVFQYKCDNYYAPQAEGALAWDDPDVAIDWGVPAESVILSEKDSKHPKLKDLDSPFELI